MCRWVGVKRVYGLVRVINKLLVKSAPPPSYLIRRKNREPINSSVYFTVQFIYFFGLFVGEALSREKESIT